MQIRFPSFLTGILLTLSLLAPIKAFAADVLVWGDSLSAAYSMPVENGWVALMGKELEPYGLEIANGSVSGEITANGLARLPAALNRHKPQLVVLELGANDGLRGMNLKQMHRNLEQMIVLSQQVGAKVLLLGMRIPPNYGPRYSSQFKQIYEDLSESQNISLIEFFLANVFSKNHLMQADNLHPNEDAQPILVNVIWPKVQSLLFD
ncbi:MAG: acyl-CoA thioesterase-1 [Parasphingorhabdus sp.]|jgi:acyl-CoA thioesterase-1